MAKVHQYWVYILLCKDGTFYTGVTNNLERRMAEHSNGRSTTCYTFSRRPVRLVYASEYRYILDAIRSEKQIKKWSQTKKKALMNRQFELLPELAKKHFSIRASKALLEVTA
jgi:putative endonuclease